MGRGGITIGPGSNRNTGLMHLGREALLATHAFAVAHWAWAVLGATRSKVKKEENRRKRKGKRGKLALEKTNGQGGEDAFAFLSFQQQQ